MVFDFRSDLAVIERLKLIPLAPWRICLGQVMVPVILTTVLEWVLIATALPSLEPNSQKIALLFGLYLIPLNFIIYAAENLMVLLFPVSLVPVGRMDFSFIGRTLVDLGVKVAAIVTFSAIAGSVGLVVSVMTDRTFITAIIPPGSY